MLRPRGLQINETGQLILMIAGAAALLFIMFKLDHLFNPIGFAVVIGIILYPIRNQPVARALLYATAYCTGFWFLYDSGHLLIPFVVAYIIAFLSNPIVVWAESKRISRPLSASFTAVVGFVVVGVSLFFAIPFITQQLTAMAKLLNQANKNTSAWLENLGIIELAGNFGLDDESIVAEITEHISFLVNNFYNGILQFNPGASSGLGNVVMAFFFIILLPFLLYFMVRDYEKIGAFVREIVTPKNVPTNYTHHIATIVGNYLRGQFIVVVISMINLSIGFYLFGVPYAFVLGVFAGITNFIPTFGLWLSLFVTSIVGITFGEPWYQYLFGIYLVFGLEQILETGFIVPRVIGKHVGLHPIVVMLSLMLFGFMFGFLGLLIAVPSVALISVFWEDYKSTNKLPFLSGAELKSEHEFE